MDINMAEKDDKDLLEQAADDIESWYSYFADNNQTFKTMQKFVYDSQWSATDAAEYESLRKPMLTFNKLNVLVKQIVGEQRDNTPNLKVEPTGDIDDTKIDGKIIPYLHYSFRKITIKEDTVDAFILEAFEEPEIGLAIEGTSNDIDKIKDKKTKKEAIIYLQFLRNSYDNVINELKDERTARIYYREQILPMAQVVAAKLLGIDIDNISKTLGIPTFEKIIGKMKEEPSDQKNNEAFEKLQDGIKEKVASES